MRRFFLLLTLSIPLFASGQSVDFSLEGGFYDGPVELELTAPGHSIHFTTDGSTPRPDDALYSRPLTLRRSTVVRAIACRDGRCTRETGHSFLIDEPRSPFPTVSVAVTPGMLFDPVRGMYREGPSADRSDWKRPGANFWSDREVLAHAEIFDADGRQVFRSPSGFRMFGGMSRLAPQKSFSLIAREKYGKKRIDYPVFGENGPGKFKSLVFRNGGSDFGKGQFRDPLMTSLLDGWDLEKQDHQPAHVYINGEYWGLFNIRQKITRFFLEDESGEDRDSIDLLVHNAHVQKGSAAHYKRMLDYMRRHDLSDDAHFAAVDRMMDTDNFMHYQIAQIYYDNQDAGGNIRFWRPQREDGRWRWVIYDVDQGFGAHDPLAYRNNTLAFQLEPNGPFWPNPPWSTFLLRQLLQNPGFRQRFITRFLDLLHTDFAADRVLQRIREFEDTYAPELPRHFQRWDIDTATWQMHLGRMREFARHRPEHLRGHLASEFALGPMQNLSFRSGPGGTLVINGRIRLENDSLAAVYPNGLEVALQAIPRPGYRFAGWRGLPDGPSQRTLIVQEGISLVEAVFEPHRHPLAEQVMINEIGAFAPRSGDWLELFNRSSVDVYIGNWILADAGHQFRLPPMAIPAGGYLVLCQDLRKFKQQFPGAPAAACEFRFGIGKRRESIALYAADGAFVDSVTYEITPLDSAFTMALLMPDLDNAQPRNWELQRGTGTPGSGNPFYVESRVRAVQAYWLRMGLYAGSLALLLLAVIWRWRQRRLARTAK